MVIGIVVDQSGKILGRAGILNGIAAARPRHPCRSRTSRRAGTEALAKVPGGCDDVPQALHLVGDHDAGDHTVAHMVPPLVIMIHM
jgi:hypothetical protein